ncbi:ORF6N domain-containing protein [Planococcus wigleyi]|uniref:ORF6N domain-containing protein n=1 Tax=Planococcus wigleyi TaxID=2762216 RepID=A0ABR8W9Z8_9BACL|nr:ORF6N domain-containing protein [Planococcus wigleyi]MBD8013850.1 ORF6N domain-containing protein [Planococcus wigleyi]
MNLSIIEKSGQRVLTTTQLADSFGTDSKTINRNFQRNSERFVESKHYFALTGNDLRDFKGSRQIDPSLKYASVLYLWTEKGAWLLAKSINSDQAWDAYEMLVDEYYKMQNQGKVLSEKEQLMASMKLSLKTAEEIQDVKREIAEVRDIAENQVTLDHGEQRRLQKAVAIKVYEIEADPAGQRRMFKELYREIKDRFAVASYKDVKRKDLQNAIRYVDAWLPRKVS